MLVSGTSTLVLVPISSSSGAPLFAGIGQTAGVGKNWCWARVLTVVADCLTQMLGRGLLSRMPTWLALQLKSSSQDGLQNFGNPERSGHLALTGRLAQVGRIHWMM